MKPTQTHTPGPWSVVNTDEGRPYTKQWREIQPNVVVAASYTTNRYGETEVIPGVRIQESDARLIAIAPDMLAALEEIDREVSGALNNADPMDAPGILAHVGGIAARALKDFRTPRPRICAENHRPD